MEDGIPEGLQHRHKTCCEKGGCHGRRAYRVQRWHHHGDVVFRMGGLAYDCYDLESLEWDSKTTLVLSNTRKLDRVPKTK